jgi:hypothetical protein
MDFILNAYDESMQALDNSLCGLGEDLKIIEMERESGSGGKSFQISISTQDPTVIFDACAQFGRIKSVKINEG